MMPIQTESSSFEQMSVIKFCWLTSSNQVTFIEDVLCKAKYVLVKKMFINGPNMDLPLRA